MPILVWGIVAGGAALGIGGGTYALGREMGEGAKTALQIGAAGVAVYYIAKAVSK